MEKTNPVVWFEIYVDDLARARRFYEKVFDLKLSELPTPGDTDDEMQMLAFPMEMEGSGASGALVKMEGYGAGGNATVIYFRSDDCSVEENRIAGAGGKVIKSKQSLDEYGAMVLAYDTEGNMFGIHSQA